MYHHLCRPAPASRPMESDDVARLESPQASTVINNYPNPAQRVLQDQLPQISGHVGETLLAHLVRLCCRQKAETGRRWSPLLLQRYVFYAFIAIFCGFVILLETSFVFSERYQGFEAPTGNSRYIWTYGPAALFGLLSAIWTCTEYTARVASPWIRSWATYHDVDYQILLLSDYVSMFSLFVPFRALRNRDYIVAAGVLVSQLLTVLIVIAPSLFKLTPIDVDHPVTATSQFANSSSRLSNVELGPLYVGIGIKQYKLHYPNGTSDQLVYQTIAQPPQSSFTIKATVTGLSIGVECHNATLQSFGWRIFKQRPVKEVFYLDMNLTTADCFITVSVSPVEMWDYDSVLKSGRFLSGSCNGTSSHLDHKRLVFWFGELHATIHNSDGTYTGWNLSRSTQVLCKPSYNVSDYEFFQVTGSHPELSLAPDPRTRTFDYLQAWDFAQAMIDLYWAPGLSWEPGYPPTPKTINQERWGWKNPSDLLIRLDAGSAAILEFSSQLFSEPSNIFDASLLASSLEYHYNLHAVLLAQWALMEPAISEVPGKVHIKSDRLIIQSLACHSMVAICLSAVLILGMAVRFLPRHVTLVGDPGTILGIAELTKQIAHRFPRGLSHKDALTADRLANDLNLWGDTRNKRENRPLDDHIAFARCLHQSRQLPPDSTKHLTRLHQPLILYATSRSSICFILVATIFTLETLLYKSTKNKGIGEVPTSNYTHYLWTALPAIILSLIGTMMSSMDLEYRIIAPYHALNRGLASINVSLNQKLLGILAPHALHIQLRNANYGGLMATGAAIIASVLSVAAGPLFYESSTFTTTSQLQLVGSFSSDLLEKYSILNFKPSSDITPMLILENNLSYPAFTYEGLALPALAWANKESSNWLNTSNLVTQAVLPALESELTCHQYSQSEITAEMSFLKHDRSTNHESLSWAKIRIYITGQYCSNRILPGTVSNSPATFEFSINKKTSSGGVFATSISFTQGIDIEYSCANQLFYVWGGFSSADPSTISASAAVCRPSISAVNVEATFSGLELSIRESQPPRRIGSFSRGIFPTNDTTYGNAWASTLYGNLASFPAKDGSILDSFFYALTTSRYAVPISALADRGRAGEVIDAIIFHHNVIFTQSLATITRIKADQSDSRYGYKDPGVFERTGQGSLNDTVPATIIGNPNNIPTRVTQNKVATRVIQALLGAILLLSILSWYFGPRQGILPRSPTSVASVLAMLVDGNLFSLCEEQSNGGNPMSFSEMAEAFGDMRLFRLGPGVGGGHARRFGIFAVDGSGLLNTSTLKMRSPESHADSQST